MFMLLRFQNRGIYMFRLDERLVVDATLSGGLARYINHSCQPNCVAETVEVDRNLRIIIFAKRRIARGEEVGERSRSHGKQKKQSYLYNFLYIYTIIINYNGACLLPWPN